MNNNTKEVLIDLIWAIAFVLMFISIPLTIAWVNTPTDFSFSVAMDSNTLEAIKSIDWSIINNRLNESINTGYGYGKFNFTFFNYSLGEK